VSTSALHTQRSRVCVATEGTPSDRRTAARISGPSRRVPMRPEVGRAARQAPAPCPLSPAGRPQSSRDSGAVSRARAARSSPHAGCRRVSRPDVASMAAQPPQSSPAALGMPESELCASAEEDAGGGAARAAPASAGLVGRAAAPAVADEMERVTAGAEARGAAEATVAGRGTGRVQARACAAAATCKRGKRGPQRRARGADATHGEGGKRGRREPAGAAPTSGTAATFPAANGAAAAAVVR